MADRDFTEYLTAVASELGTPWHVEITARGWRDIALVGLQGASVTPRLEETSAAVRVVFQSSLDEDLSPHKPCNRPLPGITVARSRSAREAAGDIRRRLLPALRDLIDDTRSRAEERQRQARELSAVVDSLAANLGVHAAPGTDTVELGRYGRPLDVKARVLQNFGRSDEHVVRFEMDAVTRHALALTELLGRLHDEDGRPD